MQRKCLFYIKPKSEAGNTFMKLYDTGNTVLSVNKRFANIIYVKIVGQFFPYKNKTKSVMYVISPLKPFTAPSLSENISIHTLE